MFVYQTQVRLKDTDATGVLYFAEQFRMALEAFEEFLKERGFGWKELLESPYLMPVVHAEGDYMAPVRVGDMLRICLEVAKIGTTSVTLQYILKDVERGEDVGKVQIVHVVIDRLTKKAVPIPDALRAILAAGINAASTCRD